MIAEGNIDGGAFFHDALDVGKGKKPAFAVVGAHAALPYAAEAHARGRKVYDGIVHAAAAELDLAQDSLFQIALFSEIIERERRRMMCDRRGDLSVTFKLDDG